MINKSFSNEALKKRALANSKIQEPKESNKLGYDCGSLIGELFRARTIAHICHLNTTSFAEHKALDTFYNEVLDLTDTFAETVFGLYGRSKIKTAACELIPDFGSYLKELRTEILEHREELKDTNIQNILDELLSLVDHTIYLLTLK